MKTLICLALAFLPNVAMAQSSFAGNAQHTAVYGTAAQNLNAVHWTTAIDLNNSGGFAHYGAPLLTPANTIFVPVKTGAGSGFEINAFNGGTGAALYSLSTDYIAPSSGWIVPYQPVLATNAVETRLYYPGPGGTVYYIDNVDSASHGAPVQQAFYTLAAYQANPSGFNSTIFIDTPITSDRAGNIFFGFRTQGTAPAPLNTAQSGYARIDPNGNGSYVLAGTAAGDSNIAFDTHNAGPAVSNDQSTIYVAVKSSNTESYGYLLGLDATTLATKYKVFLNDPRNNNVNPATILDISTASPMVGPDNDVYFGIYGNPSNGSRGFLLHFSSDLTTEKPAGGFGWDYTPGVVPASMVPSYTGSSPYLLVTKYNNYAGAGNDSADGVNRVALLDPNSTEVDAHATSNGMSIMREVLTVIGPTVDIENFSSSLPYAVREWCINSPGVDPATKSVFFPSEDGNLYRWNLVTNSLDQFVHLNPGLGEPYVPTIIGPDGTVFTLNGGGLSAVGSVAGVGVALTSSLPDVRSGVAGQSLTFNIAVSNTGGSGTTPTGTVTLKDTVYAIVNGALTPTTTTLAALPLNGGIASFTTSSLAANRHFMTATYSGDSNFSAGSSSLIQFVHAGATATALTYAPNTLTASVTAVAPASGTPSGQVTFVNGTTVLGQVPLNGSGVATLTVSNLSVGTNGLQAVYASDTVFAASTGNLATSTTVVSSLNPATFGQTVTFTATTASAVGTPSGTVTFSDGAIVLASNVTSFSTSSLAVGNHTITAAFTGAGGWGNSTSSLTQLVNAASTSTSAGSSPNPSTFGQAVTFTSNTTSGAGTPVGTVAFTEGSTVLASGIASLAVGSHNITATFTGATGWPNSSVTFTQVVNPAPTATTVLSVPNPSYPGQSVTFTSTTASAVGSPVGTVTFSEGSTVYASNLPLNGAGQASFSIATLASGSHTIVATFTGSTSWANSTGSVIQAVGAVPAWTTLTNAPPSGISNCMLLTDGGVMCQNGSAFYRLTPNSNGSYQNGTWSVLASLPSGYNPDAYASAILADGRAVIEGGEYNNGSFALSNMGAVYDPVANSWTTLAPPTTGSPNNFQCIGDAPASMLADGRFLIGSKLFQNVAVLNPATLTWNIVSATGKNDTFNSEEGWTLLPDGSIFTLDVSKAPAAERFLLNGLTSGTWLSAGNTLQDLHTPTTSGSLSAPGCPVYNPPGEMGPALLLPNGTVFAVGASGYTGVYTPPPAGSTAAGSWAIGPAMPAGLNVEDGPAALLPNGHVLFGGSPGDSGAGIKYFEFDSANPGSLISVPAPGRASNDATYFTQLLVLPSGQVMFIDGSNVVQLYSESASSTYNPAWAPAIGSVSSLTLNSASTYQISGTQFNGLSQATAFGDESQNATNYPLVRIANNATGHVFYARTHGHSSMGVATGAATVSTSFDVPANVEAGASTIQVVANGIPSAPVAITIVASTTTAVTSSPNPSSVGQTVTFTSTTTSAAGAPVGTVTFSEGSTVYASNVTVNSSGQASFSTAALATGSHTITATFTGSGWAGSTGSVTQVAGLAATSTAATSSLNPSTVGQAVTFTSTTTSGAGVPVGTVTFTDGSTVIASNISVNGSGLASFTTSALAVGSHSITAAFTGGAGWANSSGTLTQVVNSNNAPCLITNLGAAGAFSILGLANSQITVQGSLGGSAILGIGANGKLHLQNGATLSNAVFEDPSATLQIDGGSSITGTQTKESFSAIQSAAVAAAASFSALSPTQTLSQKIQTTTTISGNGGQNVIAINNQVSLQSGQNLVLSGSSGDTFIVNVAAGQNFQFQNGASIVLNGVTPSQVVFNFLGNGSNVQFQGNTAGIFLDPDGQINIQGGTHNSVFISGNQVQITGSPTVNAISCAVVNTVATTTAVSSSPNPSNFGQAVTFTSTTSSSAGTPVGTVTFTEGSTVLASNVAINGSGQASFSTTALGLGSNVVTATFKGGTGWGNSSGSAAPQVVNANATATTATSSPNPSFAGQTVTFTSTTTSGAGTPAGTVTFTNGSTILASNVTVNSSGQASFSTAALPLGSNPITATFTGSTGWGNSSANTAPQVVNAPSATATTAASSPNPSTFGQAVTFTSTSTSGAGTPAGTVTFTQGSTVLAANVPVSSGHASFSTSSLAAGSDTITATFTGGAGWGNSSGTALQTVNNAITTTAVASSTNASNSGQSVTFTSTTASESGTPSGTVTFMDGSTILVPNVAVNAAGQATFSTASLAVGSHTITAAFTGGSGWASSSGSVTQVVNMSAAPCLLTNLGAAGAFSILGLANSQINIQSPIGTSAILGVGAGGKLHLQNNVKLSNAVDEDPTATLQIDGGSSITGTQTKESFSSIQNAAVAASAAFAALTPTQTFSQQIQATTTITGNGGQNVIAINGQVKLQNGQNLVISGGYNDTFIFNVAAGQNFSLSGGEIVLNGVSASQVVFNFVGKGASVQISGNTAGIFLDLQGQITIQGGTHNSVFISGNTIQLSNNATVNAISCR